LGGKVWTAPITDLMLADGMKNQSVTILGTIAWLGLSLVMTDFY
jgi:hypothetical protein